MEMSDGFPIPETTEQIEYLEALRHELDVALSSVDVQVELSRITAAGIDLEDLEGEELTRALEDLHHQVSQDPIERAIIAEELLLRLKITIEHALERAR
jgi:hypothetical protein